MSDMVIEKLMQRVSNLVEEVTEVNILIRRLDSTRETLNKINERNDAIYAAIVHIEKSLKLDDKRLTALEAQLKSLEAQTAGLMAGLEVLKKQTALLHETLVQQKKQSGQFEQTAEALNQVVHAQEARIKAHTEKIREELKGRVGDANGLVGWLIGVNIVLILVVAAFVYLVNKINTPH